MTEVTTGDSVEKIQLSADEDEQLKMTQMLKALLTVVTDSVCLFVGESALVGAQLRRCATLWCWV
jgi:hypothetical protein